MNLNPSAPQSNPSNGPQPETDVAPAQEELIAQWQEPDQKAGQQPLNPLFLGGAGTAAIILIVVGVLAKDFTFYLAALALVLVMVSVVVQQRRNIAGRTISFTTLNLEIGDKTFPLTGLAGFWLEAENDFTAVNIEPRKRSLLPITILFPDTDTAVVKDLFLSLLPEVEPRQKNFSDALGKYIQL